MVYNQALTVAVHMLPPGFSVTIKNEAPLPKKFFVGGGQSIEANKTKGADAKPGEAPKESSYHPTYQRYKPEPPVQKDGSWWRTP